MWWCSLYNVVLRVCDWHPFKWKPFSKTFFFFFQIFPKTKSILFPLSGVKVWLSCQTCDKHALCKWPTQGALGWLGNKYPDKTKTKLTMGNSVLTIFKLQTSSLEHKRNDNFIKVKEKLSHCKSIKAKLYILEAMSKLITCFATDSTNIVNLCRGSLCPAGF